jgi:hypothetical protein
VDAKWRGKGFTLSLPTIYRSMGATLLRTPRAAPIKCRQRRQPLTGGPYRAEMATYTCVRDHYSAATEGPRRHVTFAPHIAHYACAVPPKKARLLRTTAATTTVI